jgi:GDP-L-fucose synthase
MTILILGSNGFIGKHLARHLSKTNDLILPAKTELNLLEHDAVHRALRHYQPDCIIHSAILPIHRNRPYIAENVRDNIRMVLNVALNKHANCQMIWISSGALYAHKLRVGPLCEGDEKLAVPDDDLGLAKLTISMAMQSVPNVIELRPFGIFGEYEDISIRIISNLICRAINSLPIMYNHERHMTFIDVLDFVKIVQHFIGQWPTGERIYNAGAYDLHLSEIATAIAAATDSTLPIIQLSNRIELPYIADSSRLNSTISNINYTSFETSLNRLIQWYRDPGRPIDIAYVTKWDGATSH